MTLNWNERLRVILRDPDGVVFSDDDLVKAKTTAESEWEVPPRFERVKSSILLWGAMFHAVDEALGVEGRIPAEMREKYHQIRFKSHVQWENRMRIPEGKGGT